MKARKAVEVIAKGGDEGEGVQRGVKIDRKIGKKIGEIRDGIKRGRRYEQGGEGKGGC